MAGGTCARRRDPIRPCPLLPPLFSGAFGCGPYELHAGLRGRRLGAGWPVPGPGGGSELSLRRRREDGGSQGGRSWSGGGGGTAQGPEQGAPARGLPRSPSAPVTMSSRGRLGLQDAPTQPHPHRSMRAAAEGHRRLSLDTDLSRQGAHSWHAGAVSLSERGPLRSQETMSVTWGPGLLGLCPRGPAGWCLAGSRASGQLPPTQRLVP